MQLTNHFTTTAALLLTAFFAGIAPAIAQTPPAHPPAATPPIPGPAAVPAPPAPPAPPSKPAAENDALKVFVGNWKCEGTANLGPGKTVKTKATAKVKNELGGFWQSFVYTEQKTKDYPIAITAIGTWGWESVSKKFVRGEFQSTGGYVTGTSTGWSGDSMIWDLELSNFMGKISAKHTFTKKGDKEFFHKIDAKVPGAPGPVTLFEVTCKK